MSKTMQVTLISASSPGSDLAFQVATRLPHAKESVWDTDHPDNIRKMYVISYNHLAKHYGPQAYWNAVSLDTKRYCQEKGIPEGTFRLLDEQNRPDALPNVHPSHWIEGLEGKFSIVFLDECQESLRNASNTWRAAKWLNPLFYVLMSGYPAPRGMEDYGSYLRLLEQDHVQQEHDELRAACKKLPVGAPEPAYIPGATNPYTLADDSPL